MGCQSPSPRPADGVRDTAALGESEAYRQRPRRGSWVGLHGRKTRVGRQAPPDKRRRFSASTFGVVSPEIIIMIRRTPISPRPPILSILTACACRRTPGGDDEQLWPARAQCERAPEAADASSGPPDAERRFAGQSWRNKSRKSRKGKQSLTDYAHKHHEKRLAHFAMAVTEM